MIWLIGNKGMLGSEVAAQLDAAGFEYSATDMDVDITTPSALTEHAESIFKSGDTNRWIINCSAYTAVDKAEDEPELAARINTEGVKNIAECADAFDAKVIHISTDYVFDGSSEQPLTEDMPTGPVSVYGRTKLDGEAALSAACAQHFIIRTAWLYGLRGANFVYTMLKLMDGRDAISVVNDQHGSPTNAEDLAGLIVEIIRQDSSAYGIYHYSNEGNISWHDFAKEIYSLGIANGLIGSECAVNSCSSDQFPTKAKRPAYSLLSKEKVKTTFGLEVLEWRDSLGRFLIEYENLHERINNWIEHAQYDFETAGAMQKSGRYLYVLITTQQCLEKIMKAVYDFKSKPVPRIHDLLRLAAGLELNLSDEDKKLFSDLSYYYIASRYSERIKTLSQDVSKQRAESILFKTEEVFSWLKSMIPFV